MNRPGNKREGRTRERGEHVRQSFGGRRWMLSVRKSATRADECSTRIVASAVENNGGGKWPQIDMAADAYF
jgi:hypothetical protein